MRHGFLRIWNIRNFRSFSVDFKMKYLNVAEKNDAAKNIASILSRGAPTRREGFSQYNKIYEFDAQVFGEIAKMVMTSVSGHLLNYEFAATFKNWNSCSPIALFDAPVVKTCLPDFQNIKRTLEREIVHCQGLIIWTDCDREGENIGFEIIKVCTDVKPNIRVYRAKFSEITPTSIYRALNTLGQPNRSISDAVDVRQELDLRTVTHTVKEATTEFSWKRDRLFDKNSCEAILDICKENPEATVESVQTKEKSKWRPLPLDTIEMEKNVSRKLKINSKEAMRIAERLYTQGFISYPRTETNIFPKELNLSNLVEQQREDHRWGEFATRIMSEGGPNPRQGKKSDQAHPPIHPTKYASNLTGNDQKVYEYIVRHFLACVHKDAKGFETLVIVDIADEKFTAKGLLILEKNYLDVYIYEKWTAKEINNYKLGDTFIPTILDIVESSTVPPKLLTEADLIALMDKHGIGTDATHAEHIDKIKTREYVGLHENVYFVPGTLGMGLVEGYNNVGLEVSLAKPILRAEFENDLKLICEGVKDPEVVRREQINKYRTVFQIVFDKIRLIDDSLGQRLVDTPLQVQNTNIEQDNFKPVLKCPKCGNDMIIRTKKNSSEKFLSCTAYPNCKNVAWFTSVENVEVLNQHCETCGPSVKNIKIKFKQNPFPGQPNPNVVCLGGCDTNLLEALQINTSSVSQAYTPGFTNVSNENTTHTRSNQTNLYNFVNCASTNNIGTNELNGSGNENRVEQQPRDRNVNNTLRNGPNEILCFCNLKACIEIKDDSDPNNKGKRFYKCAANTCNFFQWMSDTNMTVNNLNGMDEENEIVCACNAKALLLTVGKDGPNKGRKFYKCTSNSCGFFLWASDINESHNNAAAIIENGHIPKCNCHLPAILRTVTKTGPNSGRQFYVCPKPRGQGCNFFQWMDKPNESGGGNNGDDSGGGKGGNGKWKGGKATRGKSKNTAPYKNQPKPRKCGVCGQEGHTRNRCPNNIN